MIRCISELAQMTMAESWKKYWVEHVIGIGFSLYMAKDSMDRISEKLDESRMKTKELISNSITIDARREAYKRQKEKSAKERELKWMKEKELKQAIACPNA